MSEHDHSWIKQGGVEKNLHQQPQKRKLSFFVAVGASFFQRPLHQTQCEHTGGLIRVEGGGGDTKMSFEVRKGAKTSLTPTKANRWRDLSSARSECMWGRARSMNTRSTVVVGVCGSLKSHGYTHSE